MEHKRRYDSSSSSSSWSRDRSSDRGFHRNDERDRREDKRSRRYLDELNVGAILKPMREHPKRVEVGEPKEIAFMSRTKELEWKYGDKSGYGTFRFDEKKMIPANLNEGFEEFNRTYEMPTPDSLEHVLRAIKEGEVDFSSRPRVVAWRGILTKIMTTPFLYKDEYLFSVWKCKGVIYLSNRETEEKIRSDRNMPERMKRFMYYGYKYEEVCTREEGKESESRSVDPRECFCRVFKSKIGSTTIVGAAEMDCFDPIRGKDMELKVNRVIETPNQKRSFEKFKLLKFFCQSFLSGVPLIQVGYRDDDGNLVRTEILETLRIPRSIRGREAELWDAGLALQFLDHVLQWLLRTVPEIEEHKNVNEENVYLFHYHGNSRISLMEDSRRKDERMDAALFL